jgi:hypothetical protein
MFGSGILDSIIGLIFVFLLVSLLVTIVNEMIAAVLSSRAKWLKRGIDRLIGARWKDELYAHPLIAGTARGDSPWSGQGGPSYIPSRLFANVLMSIVQGNATREIREELDKAIAANATVEDLKARLAIWADMKKEKGGSEAVIANIVLDHIGGDGGSSISRTVGQAHADIRRFIDAISSRHAREMIEAVPDRELRLALLTLYDDAKHDVEKLKENIEVWFNNGMDRVGGWYKRRSQLVIGILALVLTVAMNVDAILIFRHLQTFPAARDALVAQAEEFAKQPLPSKPAEDDLLKQFDTVQARLMDMRIPVGWVEKGTPAEDRNGQVLPGKEWAAESWQRLRQHGLGWLLTTLAATLGAPFWFDMLNRVISIRAAGKPPEEEPKPPKTVSVPVEPGQSQQEADRIRQNNPHGR